MSEIHFSKNYRDLSESRGVNSGFQFEFYCEKCRDSWRSAFQPYSSGQVAGWAGKAANVLGGMLRNVNYAVDGIAQAGWRSAKDGAFASAVESAKKHFNRCAKCNDYVCDKCWNKMKGLCLSCAPDIGAAIESARTMGEIQSAADAAMEKGKERGKFIDVDRERQLVCHNCKAQTKGAKFCPECGTKMAVSHNCPNCYLDIPPGVKFCPECGHKVSNQ